MYPSRDLDKFVLRMPEGMRDNIRIEAVRNKRSMNAEIVYHLERAYDLTENEKGDTSA